MLREFETKGSTFDVSCPCSFYGSNIVVISDPPNEMVDFLKILVNEKFNMGKIFSLKNDILKIQLTGDVNYSLFVVGIDGTEYKFKTMHKIGPPLMEKKLYELHRPLKVLITNCGRVIKFSAFDVYIKGNL